MQGYVITIFGIFKTRRFDVNNRNHFLTYEYAKVINQQRKKGL